MKKTPKQEAAEVAEMATLEHPFKAIKRAGVPIVAYETADPAATINACRRALNGKPCPTMQWDIIEGLRPLATGNAELDQLSATAVKNISEDPAETQGFCSCMSKIAKNPPKDCIIFAHMANRVTSASWEALQALWNLRDILKGKRTTLVLLGPSVKLPAELSSDAPLFEEPIPTENDIERITDSVMNDAKGTVPTGDERARVIDSLRGYLSEFAIEQSAALSIVKAGDSRKYDLRKLWQLKVASLKGTAGLEISQPTETLSDLAGCDGIKAFAKRLLNGRKRFRGVFFLDEIEKMLAGGQGDLSGVSQGLIEQWLYWTEARKVVALLLLGIPGAGKSQSAKCIAGEAQAPLLRGSMSTVKGGIVGESEQNMRQMLRAVDSVTSGQTLMIATCNSLENLTPEIMARFKMGVFFYDYPNKTESGAIWDLYRKRYEITDPVPDNVENWVGREIESCCDRAWMFNCSLKEAAQSVVPVCRANKTKMEDLRGTVDGRFLSASNPGVYTKPKGAADVKGSRFED